jgi:hypothetical protein
LEEYKVLTKDGWVLNLYRIPYGKNRNNKPGKRPVIYLHHGITLSSACFTLFNEHESMAYILADAGAWGVVLGGAGAYATLDKECEVQHFEAGSAAATCSSRG